MRMYEVDLVLNQVSGKKSKLADGIKIVKTI
jgi:hypothetical protein